MKFKDFITEGIIIPEKIKITTTDLDELEDQFAETIIIFMDYVDSMDEMRAAYIPELDEIEVYIYKDAPFNTIEAMIQHEIIHSMQDNKSGMRMVAGIKKERDAQDKIVAQIKKLNMKKPESAEKATKLMKELETLEKNRAFLNHEEYMTYAYMAVKMRGSDKISEVIKDFNNWWKKMTGKKMPKKMMKYFASYWMVKEEL